GRRDPGLLLPLEQPQFEDDQAPPRQAPREHRDDRRPGDRSSLAAVWDPILNPFDFVLDRPAVTVGARAIHEALLDQAAGQRIELCNSAGASHAAPADAAVRFDNEQELDASAGSALAKVARVIGRPDRTGNLDEIGSALIIRAVALATPSTARAAAERRPGAA